ncbi:hypothetical protein GGF46_001568 [Coemansia sp. RSA 552]|nr:hypothetical protein GGF46_001568 [Coemansia sp. RSA 552]
MALADITLQAANACENRPPPSPRQTTLFDALSAAQRRRKRQRTPQCKAPSGQENASPEGDPATKRLCLEPSLPATQGCSAPEPCYRPPATPAFGVYNVHAVLRARCRRPVAPEGISTFGRLASLVSPAARVFRLHTDTEPNLSVLPLACKYSNMTGTAGRLALVDEGGYISIFNTLGNATGGSTEEGQALVPLLRWKAHENAVFDAEWRGDNTQIVTASADETCCLWDVERQMPLGSFAGHSQTVRSVSWRHEDAHCFASGSRDGSVLLWDARCNRSADGTHRPVNAVGRAHHGVRSAGPRARGAKRRIVSGSVTAVCHMRHRPHLIASAGSTSEVIRFWDVRARAAPRASALPTPVASTHLPAAARRSRGIASLALDADGSRLYAACNDSRVHVHNALAPGSPVARLAAPEFECQRFSITAAASPCGRRVAAGSSNGDVVVWELDSFGQNSSARRAVLQGHAKEAGCVAWYPGRDRTQLATCGDDGTLRLWDENPSLAESARSDPARSCTWGFSSVRTARHHPK